jgi:GDPmannose 4,6-dehydratase
MGNLNSKRDWGHAKDYVKAISLMLEQDKPEDYVIASGETHSVKEFIELAFKRINVDIVFEGEGLDEIGIDKDTRKTIIVINPKYLRALELNVLLGDSSKAREKLGWKPTIDFKMLVNLMVDNATM